MGKHKRRRRFGISVHNGRPGCMWGVFNVLNYQPWCHTKRRLAHTRHVDGKQGNWWQACLILIFFYLLPLLFLFNYCKKYRACGCWSMNFYVLKKKKEIRLIFRTWISRRYVVVLVIYQISESLRVITHLTLPLLRMIIMLNIRCFVLVSSDSFMCWKTD